MVMKTELPGNGVKHVVVLMLENRGFDHIMGWLYDDKVKPAQILGREGDERPFLGLSSLSKQALADLANPTPSGGALPINKGARSPKTPAYNTGESFEHIMNQVWTKGLKPEAWFNREAREALIQKMIQEQQPTMRGYVLDYNLDVQQHMKISLGKDDLSEVLDTYTPEQVPVLSGLARYYSVSDEWYCSVPSQTNTNRAFSLSGTSRGMVNNSFYDPDTWNPGVKVMRWWEGKSHSDELPVSTRCLFEVLEQHNYDWKVYWQDTWPPKILTLGMEWQYTRTMFPLLQNKKFDKNFKQFDASKPNNDFFEDCRNGRLPAVSWIEPKWGGGVAWNSKMRGVGNDYHPVSDTTVGEDFVMNVYNALSSHENWKDTLLIITFDENGGTYDHMFPPLARPSKTDACPLPEPPIVRGDMDEETRTQFGFGFAQFGVRVPTLLISPRVPRGTIFRSREDTPFDHTSMIATVLRMARIPDDEWMMGDRVAHAPTFEHLLAPGPVADIPDPTDALKVSGVREAGDALNYNTQYIFEYVGDIWHSQPGPVYLTKSAYGRMYAFSYPTFTADPEAAITFSIAPVGGGDVVTPILNMSTVRIKTSERSPLGNSLLTVRAELAGVFYDHDASDPGAQWQMRLLSSRDRRDEIRVNDLVFFVSQLQPAIWQKLSEQTHPDPMQRLLPWPKDPTYATTRAGEWGLWRIRPKPLVG